MPSRHILVTGANRGIGLAIVKGLCQNKDDTIYLGYRSSFEEKLPDNVVPVKLDLSTHESTEQGIAHIQKNFPPLQGLINNAGVLVEENIFDLAPEKFADVCQANLLANYQLIKAFLPSMQKEGYGRIVNMSSGWGSFGEGLSGPFSYSFSKASLNALTKTIAMSVSGNVAISSMCPGWVATRMGGSSAPRTPEQGAATAIWLMNQETAKYNGKFLRDEKEIQW